MRDLDFLRDEECAPLAYEDARHWTADRRETGCPQGRNGAKRSGNIAESLEGDITIEPNWLSEHVGVMPEDCVRIDPAGWAQIAGFIEQREEIRATYQKQGSGMNPLIIEARKIWDVPRTDEADAVLRARLAAREFGPFGEVHPDLIRYKGY